MVTRTTPRRGYRSWCGSRAGLRDRHVQPARVTVFGQSAGAGSVAALLAMPRAAGLFRRAVAQSVFSTALAADIAAACAAELGLRPTVADLSTVSPTRLPAAADAVTATIDKQTPLGRSRPPIDPVRARRRRRHPARHAVGSPAPGCRPARRPHAR
ncbi:MAG TPA: carboxylesterase family protein [Pseudonocardiaceae bacterium]